jgi:hypothetical protein
MPTPHEVFENPLAHWAFLTAAVDTDFEGQFFDRKEASRPAPGMTVLSSKEMGKVMEQVRETVSAFANVNKAGGLLVIGISKTGEVKGIDHLNCQERGNMSADHRLGMSPVHRSECPLNAVRSPYSAGSSFRCSPSFEARPSSPARRFSFSR